MQGFTDGWRVCECARARGRTGPDISTLPEMLHKPTEGMVTTMAPQQSQQLSLDVADLEIEALDLIPADEAAGEHDVIEIGASCGDNVDKPSQMV